MGSFYIEYEYWFAATQLILAMFGMGATLTGSDFNDVVQKPKPAILGTLIQLAFVPLLAYVFISVFGLVGGLAVGLALVAAIPGGTTSNIFTFMARGNSPLSISITGITTLACLGTTPLILSLLITEFLPADFTMPAARIVTEIALTLLLPLALGMLVLKFWPRIAPLISKWSIRASLFAIVMIVVGSSSAGRLDIEAFGWQNVLLVLGFLIVLVISGWLAPRILGLSDKDSIAIEMEVIVRNANLGVLIKASMFPAIAGVDNQMGDAVLSTVLLYGGLQLLVATALILFHRRRN